MINIFVLVTIRGHLPVILSAKSKGSENMEQILIVEDDSFLNKMVAYNLTADGYGVTSALNARTAADAIRQREFDLVLLDNAVKYTPAGGKIAVSVVLWEMYVEVKVTDTGKGISESNQAAIFRRFYREEEVHEQQGVGIGLYLAREIVTRQGGYIKVVSEPGKGSEFSIMLPTK